LTTSVVVVSYRPGDWLGPCLASVVEQADELVLVDNGSAGAAASLVGRRFGAVVVRNGRNLGFAPAVGAGAAAAAGDIIALLNDDAMAAPGWLVAAEKVLADPSVAAVGPKVVLAGKYREVVLPVEEWKAPGDPRPLGRQVRSVLVDGQEVVGTAAGPGLHRTERDSAGDTWRWTAGERPWYVPLGRHPEGHSEGALLVDGEEVPAGPVVRLVNSAGAYLDKRGYAGDIGIATADDGRFDEAADRFAVSGVAFVTTRRAWRQLGPFAGRYFAYYEDIDWCWRAQLAGLRLVYDPAVPVEHRRSASSGGEHQPRVRVMAERNRTLTMVRNGPSGRAARALVDRWHNGPDGGVRAGTARLLPWAVLTRAELSRRWQRKPEEIWSRWAGVGTQWADGPAGPAAWVS